MSGPITTCAGAAADVHAWVDHRVGAGDELSGARRSGHHRAAGATAGPDPVATGRTRSRLTSRRAFFHMLPEAVVAPSNDLALYVRLVAGFLAFFLLEQLPLASLATRPSTTNTGLATLILLADGLHNFIGGLRRWVAASAEQDIRVGVVTCRRRTFHEIPKELGTSECWHSGWRPPFRSHGTWPALTFLVGGLPRLRGLQQRRCRHQRRSRPGTSSTSQQPTSCRRSHPRRAPGQDRDHGALLSGLAILLLATRLV